MQIGAAEDSGFFFDNETPRHEVLLRPYRIGNRLITNSRVPGVHALGRCLRGQ